MDEIKLSRGNIELVRFSIFSSFSIKYSVNISSYIMHYSRMLARAWHVCVILCVRVVYRSIRTNPTQRPRQNFASGKSTADTFQWTLYLSPDHQHNNAGIKTAPRLLIVRPICRVIIQIAEIRDDNQTARSDMNFNLLKCNWRLLTHIMKELL